MHLSRLLYLLESQKDERVQFVKTQMGGKLSLVTDDVDSLLAKIAEIDPSPNGGLIPWIARLIAKDPDQNKPEDLDRLAGDITVFLKHKREIANKDLNSYKSFQAVYDAIAPFMVKKKPTADERSATRQAAKIAKFKTEIETIYSGPEGWVRIPHSKGSAQFLGQGTRWCTSAKSQCQFDSYNERDKLFVVFDKSKKERFQLHIETGSYADSADKMQDITTLPDWARPAIIAWYKKNRPDLSFKHVMRLGTLGADVSDLGDDTHGDLLSLMSQYGV